MKKIMVFLVIIFSVCAFAETTLDVNITYEGSQMKVKETICGITPDLENGYAADADGCYYTTYVLDEPLYGYVFEPRTKDLPAGTRAAYYIAFYDSTIPEGKKLHTYVMNDGEKIRSVEGLYHDRIIQGVVVLKDGEYLRMTSDKEPPYIYIYIVTFIVVIIGVFFIVRRKN